MGKENGRVLAMQWDKGRNRQVDEVMAKVVGPKLSM
jgi:hypothetical protein